MRHYDEQRVLFTLAAASHALRIGRPKVRATVYSGRNPQLLLQIKVQNQSRYVHLSDLRKMQRTAVTLTDPMTNASHVYEGVALERLISAKALALEGESIEIQFGSRRTIRISRTDLDSQTKPMVIDTVDGRQLSGYAPYYVVIKLRGKPAEKIADVQCIAIKSS